MENHKLAVIKLPATVAIMAIVLLLGGCTSVGPDFTKPDAPIAESWLESDPRISADSEDYAEWWKNFSDPVLEALIQRAYRDNLTLEIAGLRVYEGKAQLGFAIGAQYPQVAAGRASVDHISFSENAEPISSLPSGVDLDFTNYRVGFDTTWEIDFWGKYKRIIEAAEASHEARIAAYDAVLVTVTSEVASAYIRLRTIEKRLAVARSNVAIQDRSLEISEVRHRNEITSELDVVQARSQLNNTKASIPRLEATHTEIENALSLLLGTTPGELRDIIGAAGDIPDTPTSVAVGIPADLLRRRPDIRQAENLAAVQSAAIGVTKAELYPSFNLAGTVGFAAASTGDLLDSGSLGGIGVLGVRWNVFSFGRIENRVRADDARFQQALAGYEQVVLNAAREVESAQTNFIKAQQEVKYLTVSAKAAERAVELAVLQYSDGIADFTRVLTAQSALTTQESILTDARGRVARDLISIYRALGGGWQIREGHDFISVDVKEQMSERTDWGNMMDSPVNNETKTENDQEIIDE